MWHSVQHTHTSADEGRCNHKLAPLYMCLHVMKKLSMVENISMSVLTRCRDMHIHGSTISKLTLQRCFLWQDISFLVCKPHLSQLSAEPTSTPLHVMALAWLQSQEPLELVSAKPAPHCGNTTLLHHAHYICPICACSSDGLIQISPHGPHSCILLFPLIC